MNWKFFAQFARPVRRPTPSPGVRRRPNLDVLEDRTVPSHVPFHILQNQSPLALSGTIGGADIQPQGPGSLITTYFGDFQTDIDEANGTIRFIGTGNDFCSADSGRWAPLPDGSDGTASAAYGARADLKGTALAAIRDFHWEADTGGSALALYTNDDGSFGFASAQTLNIHQGVAAFSHPTLGQGSADLGGMNGPNQAGDGNLVDNGDGTLVLTVPVSFSVSGTMGGIDYTLNFDGTMVGTGAFTGPGPGAHPPKDATEVALAYGPRPLGTALPAAPGTDLHGLAPESPRGVTLAAAAAPFQLQDVRPGDSAARLVHHALPAASGPFTALDSVFQELA
jgi:hypothetical protein